MLIYKSYNKWRKKYVKFNHEILYTKFLIKTFTPYSERTTRRTKNFTPNLFFFHQIRKILHETSKFLHQIRNILHRTQKTVHQTFRILNQIIKILHQTQKNSH